MRIELVNNYLYDKSITGYNINQSKVINENKQIYYTIDINNKSVNIVI